MQPRSGTLALRTTRAWNPSFIFTGSGGSTRASVVPNESFALLVDGDICTSDGPPQTATSPESPWRGRAHAPGQPTTAETIAMEITSGPAGHGREGRPRGQILSPGQVADQLGHPLADLDDVSHGEGILTLDGEVSTI